MTGPRHGPAMARATSAPYLPHAELSKEAALICEGLGATSSLKASAELGSTEKGLTRKLVIQPSGSRAAAHKSSSPRRRHSPRHDYTKRYLDPHMGDAPVSMSFHIESFARSVARPAPAPQAESLMRSRGGGAPMARPYKTTWSSLTQLPNGLVGDFHVHGTNPGFSRTPYGGFYTNYK